MPFWMSWSAMVAQYQILKQKLGGSQKEKNEFDGQKLAGPGMYLK
jgi:hypothetical protein